MKGLFKHEEVDTVIVNASFVERPPWSMAMCNHVYIVHWSWWKDYQKGNPPSSSAGLG